MQEGAVQDETARCGPSPVRAPLRLLEAAPPPARLDVDGFFTLNAQPADLDLLPGRYRLVVRASEALRKLSATFPALGRVANSLYIHARPRS